VLIAIAIPSWAADKKSKTSKPELPPSQITESSIWNQKVCPGGIEDWKVLVNLNPFDSKDKCFEYQGRLVQLLSRNQALFSLITATDPFALVDFGKDSAPLNYFSGVVLGKGAYSYQTVSGSQKIVLSFASVPKSKGREAWERKQASEKTAAEATKRAQARAKAEQEWKEDLAESDDPELTATPFTFSDTSTGLMWARNGNIAETKMDVKDAIEWVKTLNYGGYSDWRLPTKDEFDLFIKNNSENKGRHRRLNDGFFNIKTGSATYLTNTRYENKLDIFWSFCYGFSKWQAVGPVSSGFIWPVRGGKVSPQEQQ